MRRIRFMNKKERTAGCLLGLACGDALGRPVEFKSPDTIDASHGTLDEMVGFGTHGQPAGTITDDTELALRIARSLVSTAGFDGADIASRFVSWYDSGPFDIGLMTSDALSRIQAGAPWDDAGQAVWESRPEGSNAGNGSVMRCAPYAIAYAGDEQYLGEISERSSAITHADPRCTRGCAVLNLTIAAFLRGDHSPLGQALETTYPGQSEAPELIEALTGVPESLLPKRYGTAGTSWMRFKQGSTTHSLPRLQKTRLCELSTLATTPTRSVRLRVLLLALALALTHSPTLG
jgi:ADP-ribosyl-[dinitrogen reductase] hydrolase